MRLLEAHHCVLPESPSQSSIFLKLRLRTCQSAKECVAISIQWLPMLRKSAASPSLAFLHMRAKIHSLLPTCPFAFNLAKHLSQHIE